MIMSELSTNKLGYCFWAYSKIIKTYKRIPINLHFIFPNKVPLNKKMCDENIGREKLFIPLNLI